jgi:hypothetical protein
MVIICDNVCALPLMERRVRGNFHARCGVGENPEMTSKDYLSPSPIRPYCAHVITIADGRRIVAHDSARSISPPTAPMK